MTETENNVLQILRLQLDISQYEIEIAKKQMQINELKLTNKKLEE